MRAAEVGWGVDGGVKYWKAPQHPRSGTSCVSFSKYLKNVGRFLGVPRIRLQPV